MCALYSSVRCDRCASTLRLLYLDRLTLQLFLGWGDAGPHKLGGGVLRRVQLLHLRLRLLQTIDVISSATNHRVFIVRRESTRDVSQLGLSYFLLVGTALALQGLLLQLQLVSHLKSVSLGYLKGYLLELILIALLWHWLAGWLSGYLSIINICTIDQICELRTRGSCNRLGFVHADKAILIGLVHRAYPQLAADVVQVQRLLLDLVQLFHNLQALRPQGRQLFLSCK